MKKRLVLLIIAGLSSCTASFEAKSNELPENYETLDACSKENFIWNEKILHTQNSSLPPYPAFNPVQLITSALSKKMDWVSDAAPKGWSKAIHPVGMVAPVRFEAEANTPFTGFFEGAPCGLLRMSLTRDPAKGVGVAPGLALKLFASGRPSVNVSAIVSFDGQGENYNLFASEYSNIAPESKEFGPKFINWVFSRVSKYPRALFLKEMASVDPEGQSVEGPVAPFRVYFVPTAEVQFPASPARDVREDLARIPSGSHVFDVYASPAEIRSDADAVKAEKSIELSTDRKQAVRIGRIVTKDEFISSQFGDSELFFRHQRFAEK